MNSNTSLKMKLVRKLLKLRKDANLKKQKKSHFNSVYDILQIKNKLRNTPAIFTNLALRYIKHSRKNIAEVNCVCMQPKYNTKHFKDTPKCQDILFFYIHGGGFVNGFAEQGTYFIKAISRRIGCSALAVDYTLSPEAVFPLALNQILEVYKEVIKEYDPNKIILGGESAGGNLCLALLLKLKQEKIAMPKMAIIASGYLDLTNGGASYISNDQLDVTLSKTQTPYMSTAYIAGNKPQLLNYSTLKNPLVSPIFGDFTNLPPIYFSVCCDELLYSDTLTAYNNCLRDNVKAKMKVAKNCFHAFMVTGDIFEEGKQTNNDAAKFIKAVMKLETINLID